MGSEDWQEVTLDSAKRHAQTVLGNTKESPILSRTHNNPIRRTDWQFNWKEDLEAGKCEIRYADPRSMGFLIDHGPEATIRKGSKLGTVVGVIGGVLPTVEGAKIEPTDYEYINSKRVLRKRLEQCGKESPGTPPTPPNILNLDFVEIVPKGESVYDTVKAINKERAEERGLTLQ